MFSVGGGKVVSYEDTDKESISYPVGVLFDTLDYIVNYAENGAMFENQKPRLSFTEYDLVNGGCSQTRPLPDISMYTPIFVKGKDGDLYLRIFHHWSKDNNPVCFLEDSHGIERKRLVGWEHGYFLELPEDFKKEIETYERVDN